MRKRTWNSHSCFQIEAAIKFEIIIFSLSEQADSAVFYHLVPHQGSFRSCLPKSCRETRLAAGY